MPKIGNVFINTVETEQIDKSVTVTDNPIESGVSIADHVQKDPQTLQISGVIVGTDASSRKDKLFDYMNKGTLVDYLYKTSFKNCIVEKVTLNKDSTVSNGYSFNVTLKEIRIANKAVVYKTVKTKPKTSKGHQQPKGTSPKKIYVVKKGDSLSKIAAKYNETWPSLYNKNKKIIGKNPNKIYPGQKLVV